MKNHTLINSTLFLILSGIACVTQADDIYNFYFQKNPPVGAPGTTNVVTPASAQPANTSPTAASTTPLSTVPVASQTPAPAPALAPVPAPAAQVAAAAPPSPVEVEPPFRHWNIGLGLEKFTATYSPYYGAPPGSATSNNAVSLNLGYDFSKNWGIWTQVYFSGVMTSGGQDAYGNPLPSTAGPLFSQIDASAALTYTPLIIPLFGNHSLKLSLLVGAITANGIAMTSTPSVLGMVAEPMWGAVASYNFSDKVSVMVDTKDYEQALPSLNYVSDQIGFNLSIKL